MEYKLTFKKYSEALKQSKLLGLKCLDCGAITVPPKMVCQQCGSTNLEVTELKGSGVIQTFTSVFVPAEGREGECPYIIVMVKLDEGPWIMGNLEGVEPRQATMAIMGKRVKIGAKVFDGDKYSAGASARPLFALEN
ncbi:MAG: Zn-ribbon domain-containing OB-fold protein [Chloroflexi bacterium]|nr:Zn-ribbon domain-containing OB-fold protein [Chloroflexota bacterium]